MEHDAVDVELLRQEVVELTELMREDSDFRDIHDLVVSKGLSVDGVLLAGLIEREADYGQYGFLVVDDGQCILFDLDRYGSVHRWERVDDVSALEQDFHTVAVAIDMRRNGGTV